MLVTTVNEQIGLLLSQLNEQQKKIVKLSENMIVTACPGSGKTRVLTYKLAYDAMLHPESRKKIVAITYTNRAADEIKDRLDSLEIANAPIWAGTIHQFCLEYIIYPYSINLPRLCKGFKIIDEYVQSKYIQLILDEMEIELPYYKISKITTKLDDNMNIIEELYPQVVKRYHEILIDKREIDFDLILTISYIILNTHPIAAINISSILRSIYVDEYQDTNELQYQIIGILSKSNNKIKMLFVGDIDQAIYGTLGGVAKSVEEINELTKQKFFVEALNGCYRSTQRLADYYSYFQSNRYKIVSLSNEAKIPGTILLNNSINKDNLLKEISEIIQRKIDENIRPNEICIIAPQWYLLYPLSKELRKLLPDIPFDAPDISPIKMDDLNVFYKFARLIFTESGKKVTRRKRIASEIINNISQEFNVCLPEKVDAFWILQKINSLKPNVDSGVDHYYYIVVNILKLCGVDELSHAEIYSSLNEFISKINERIKKHNLASDLDSFKKIFKEREGVVITTCHKIKGEEYNTVIAFGILFGMIPHWEAIYSPTISEIDEAKKMLYVIASRAKKSLYLFAEQGRRTQSGKSYALTEILKNYDYNYDLK